MSIRQLTPTRNALYWSIIIRCYLQTIYSLHIYINTFKDRYYNTITTDPWFNDNLAEWMKLIYTLLAKN